ncbi:MAG: glycosyltransferase family 2 protein [Lachnospiraceae bacterium]|nr:glycosyltransferase family 2 protein [Lachnospiraceae bacterium]
MSVTVSLCMIVKNEEKILSRCLDSICDLMDEIIIVDTGSTDATKKIASGYTDKIYDFEWVDDFAKARNFAFSKACCDYIYSADADEVLDEENRERFRKLKENLIPDIEIVQMYYVNQLEQGTVYNFDRELRAKLFKRIRNFTWVDPVHEMVRELPVVYDSDIEIIHMPQGEHSGRDIRLFEKASGNEGLLSARLTHMYAKELMISGKDEEVIRAGEYFTRVAEDEATTPETLKDAVCVIVRASYLKKDHLKMYHYALKEAAMEPASEVCYYLGEYYRDCGDLKEASVWYYNAAFETECALNIRYKTIYSLERLAEVFDDLGNEEAAANYRNMLKDNE